MELDPRIMEICQRSDISVMPVQSYELKAPDGALICTIFPTEKFASFEHPFDQTMYGTPLAKKLEELGYKTDFK